jgi:hypothetical protein
VTGHRLALPLADLDDLLDLDRLLLRVARGEHLETRRTSRLATGLNRIFRSRRYLGAKRSATSTVRTCGQSPPVRTTVRSDVSADANPVRSADTE